MEAEVRYYKTISLKLSQFAWWWGSALLQNLSMNYNIENVDGENLLQGEHGIP